MYHEQETNQRVIYQATAFSALMRKVYIWMTLALSVSGLTALYCAQNSSIMSTLLSSSSSLWMIMIAEIALVIILTARIQKMSFATAGLMFILYSILNGVALSFIFLAYTMSSITSTFFITAGTFGAMSLIGYSTIIASVVNIFMASNGLQWIISIIGVIIFVGLTAYDTQKIKQMFLVYGDDVNESTQKLALLGSLTLYLDFINLFLYLLRFFGKSRD